MTLPMQQTAPIAALITHDALELDSLIDFVSAGDYGAVVTFAGVVRAMEDGRELEAIEYEHHPVMAQPELEKIVHDAVQKYSLEGAACVHRVGRVPVGEASVLVVVATGHRTEAFAACRAIIDRLKTTVPIWKKPVFASQ